MKVSPVEEAFQEMSSSTDPFKKGVAAFRAGRTEDALQHFSMVSKLV